jgi:UDP-N-acetylmuramate--alanine ligase
MDLDKINKIYMIGIKGVGMTMLAQYLHGIGKEISGSDTHEVFMTDKALRMNGIKYYEGFAVENIPQDADLVIYSTAYNEKNNVEVADILRRGIKMITAPEGNSLVFNQSHGIAVCGSHGKTTTSAWLGYVLQQAGKNPNVLVGSYIPQFSGLCLVGKSNLMIMEADEYQNKLNNYYPKSILLNNIDYDHPDFFPDDAAYVKVFLDFIKKLGKNGLLIANFDDAIVRSIAKVNCRGKVSTYAIDESADYVAYDLRNSGGKQYFKVKLGIEINDDDISASGESAYLGDFSINLPGKHNIYNALAVIAYCLETDIDLFVVRKYLEEFFGAERRMEKIGIFHGALLYDDYAHHPTEIRASLAGFRQMYPDKNIIAVFRPHTFTRTKFLLDGFSQSFADADEVIVLDIYGSAREKRGGVHSNDLVAKIKGQKSEDKAESIHYISELEEAEKYLRGNVGPNDVVVLMGAGDQFMIGRNLIK